MPNPFFMVSKLAKLILPALCHRLRVKSVSHDIIETFLPNA